MKFLKFVVSCLLLINLSAHAEKGYSVLNPPQPVETGKKIEVLEFFYFGCIHCYDLQKYLEPWLKTMPKDVEFRYVPTIFDDAWAPLAKTFYSLEVLGIEPKYHGAVYNAVMNQNINLADPATMLDWAAKQGIDRKQFSDAYSSFSVQMQVSKSKQMTRGYSIQGTPTLVVDGKYVTSPSKTGSPQATVAKLDELIKMARADRAHAPRR